MDRFDTFAPSLFPSAATLADEERDAAQSRFADLKTEARDLLCALVDEMAEDLPLNEHAGEDDVADARDLVEGAREAVSKFWEVVLHRRRGRMPAPVTRGRAA